jgi:hypothetical protein
MPEIEMWRIFASLGVPGLALGIFYMLFRAFHWDFPRVPQKWVGPLVLLFMLLTSAIVFYALTLWAPQSSASTNGNDLKTPTTAPTTERREREPLQVNCSLRDDLCSWYIAESDTLKRFPAIDGSLDAYYGGADAEILIPGLWAGDILSGVTDPLAKSQLQRSLLRVIPQLVAARDAYHKGERTMELDDAWNLFPTKRRMAADLTGFSAFARILYPKYAELENDDDMLRRRDALIGSLRANWKLPENVLNRESDRDAETRLFYDILTWRTTPVFALRITNPDSVKYAIDELELVSHEYRPFKDTMVSGPIEVLANVRFRLRGSETTQIAAPVNVGIAPGDVGDILVHIESTKKAYYKIQLALKSNRDTLWQSAPLYLIYNY